MGIFDSIGQGIQNDVSYIVNDVLGIKKAKDGTAKEASLPWKAGNKTPSTSTFLPPISIDPARFDSLYPYRLVVVDTSDFNSIVGGNLNKANPYVGKASGDDYIINFEPIQNRWVFVLPITTQQLNITDQFSINTTATLRGVLEEHNGVKFKTITMAGTMGVWPYKESVTHSPTTPGLIRSLLGGTIDAIGNVVTSVTNTINALTTGSTASKPKTVRPEESQAGKYSTGYFAAMSLAQFLEQYAEAKKNPDNASWRLVLDIPKQNQSLVVSPMQFTWSQNAQNPLWVNYNLSLKAWRRINLANKAVSVNININKVSPGLLQRLLNTVTAARTVMASAINLINAVRSDADKPLEILKQTSLLLKDGAGVGAAAADLPKQIANDYQSSITQYVYSNRISITQQNTDPGTTAAVASIVQDRNASEGLNSAAVMGGQIGTAAMNLQSSSPTNQIFANSDEYFTLFNAVPLSGLALTTAQQNQINSLFDEIRQITVDDLKQFRSVIADLAFQISNYLGTSTAYYNKMYGKGTANVKTQPITLDDYQVLNSLYGVMEAYDLLTSTNYYDQVNAQTNMEYVAGLADSSNIAFSLPNSKIVVPVPYGLTVEGIALRYLNDAQRWLEIVTLNNLREPYIDETGFQKPLLSNGIDRQVVVGDSTNLYVGQVVTVKSSTALPTTRKILNIDILNESSVLITLDGTANMSNYLLSDLAYLQAYLPGTTNSQQKIFIPSDLVAQPDDGVNIPAAVSSDPLTGLSKVDFLMTDDGDLATNNFGDFRLSAGLTNLIQAIKIKMQTKKGSLLLHPEFGLGINPGMSSSDFTTQDIYDTINKIIQDDPRFGGIEKLQIQLGKGALTINLSVFLTGSNGVLPLTFDLKI